MQVQSSDVQKHRNGFQFWTFARFCGRAVVFVQHGREWSRVRYIGPEGKAISRETFCVLNDDLEAF